MAGHGARLVPSSVADLDTEAKRPADVVVDLTARQGKVELASGRTVEGYSLNDKSPGPLIEATVGQLVEVRLHNESVKGGVALHWHGVDVPNAQDGVAGVTQDAVGVGEDHTYRWVAPDAGTLLVPLPPAVERAGDRAGCSAASSCTPRSASRACGTSWRWRTCTTTSPRSTGDTGFRPVVARPGERVRVRVVNTDNGPQNAWADVPFLVRAVDGIDVNEPTEVTGPVGEHPRRRAGRPGGPGARPTAAPCGCRCSAVSGSSIGPPGSESPSVKQPEGELDLLDYGSAGDVGFDPAQPDRKFDYSVGRRPGFLDGQARAVVERQRQALPGHADVRRPRG